MKILSVEDCEKEIKSKEEALSSDPDNSFKYSELVVWKRIKKLVEDGKTITIDSNDVLKLWDQPNFS